MKEKVDCQQEIEPKVKLKMNYSRERQGMQKEEGVHVRRWPKIELRGKI